MYRLPLLLALVSCSQSSPVRDAHAAPDAAVPRNLICERLRVVQPKAECVPELTDVSELRVHSARVTIEKTILACRIDATRIDALCSDRLLVVVSPEPTQPQQAEQPERKPKAKPKAK